jgi:hypothetical protein
MWTLELGSRVTSSSNCTIVAEFYSPTTFLKIFLCCKEQLGSNPRNKDQESTVLQTMVDYGPWPLFPNYHCSQF